MSVYVIIILCDGLKNYDDVFFCAEKWQPAQHFRPVDNSKRSNRHFLRQCLVSKVAIIAPIAMGIGGRAPTLGAKTYGWSLRFPWGRGGAGMTIPSLVAAVGGGDLQFYYIMLTFSVVIFFHTQLNKLFKNLLTYINLLKICLIMVGVIAVTPTKCGCGHCQPVIAFYMPPPSPQEMNGGHRMRKMKMDMKAGTTQMTDMLFQNSMGGAKTFSVWGSPGSGGGEDGCQPGVTVPPCGGPQHVRHLGAVQDRPRAVRHRPLRHPNDGRPRSGVHPGPGCLCRNCVH